MHRYLRRPVQGNLMKFFASHVISLQNCRAISRLGAWHWLSGGEGGAYSHFTSCTHSQLYECLQLHTTWSCVLVHVRTVEIKTHSDALNLKLCCTTLLCPELATTGCSASPSLSQSEELRSVHLFFYAVGLILFAHTIDTNVLLSSLWVVRTWLLQFFIFI